MIAYKLAASFAGSTDIVNDAGTKIGERPTFQGGDLAIGGTSFDVGAHLEANDGLIVVDDANQPLVVLLDAYDALVRTKVPEGAQPVGAFGTLPKLALLQLAAERGIATTGLTKSELAQALEDHTVRSAGGVPVAEREPGNVADDGDDTVAAEAKREAAEEAEAEQIRVAQAAAQADADEHVGSLSDEDLTALVDGLTADNDSVLAQSARAELETRTANSQEG